MHAAHPWTWPLQAISFQWLYTLCHTWTRRPLYMQVNRDLGFSLTDNWCVIWDPPLMAHVYCFGFRCPTSPYCLVASRYILMTDVWPLLAPWRMCFAGYWPALLMGPAYVAPTYQWSVNARGPVSTQAPQSRVVTRSAKRLSPCPGLPTWLCVIWRKYGAKVTSFWACLICAHVSLIND